MKYAMGALAGCVAVLLVFLPAPAGTTEEYGLEDLFRLALERSEKVRLSEENLVLAETQREKALAALVPRLTAFSGVTRYTESKVSMTGSLIQPDTAATWGLRLDQSLSLSGREFTALRLTKSSIDKSRLDLQTMREDLLLVVAAGYFDVWKAEREWEIAEANVARLTEHRNAAEKRLKVGEVTRTALLRAEGELSGALSDRVKAKNLLALSRSFLARTVGIAGDFRLREPSLREEGVPALADLQARALAERSDVRSLLLQKQMAEGQVTVSEGAYWPSVSVTGVYAGADQSPAPAALNRESVYGGLSLNFPFFEGGLRVAEVKEARTRNRQAGLQLEDQKKSVLLEVEGVYRDLDTQRGTLRFLEDQVVYARDNFRAVSRQFEEGLASSIDIMDANTLLVSAEQRWVAATYQYQIALLKLKRVTGASLRDLPGAAPAAES